MQQTCGTGTSQQFRFNLVAVTALHSNKLLDIYGGANQKFRLTKQPGGSYYLTAMHSNLRVGVRSNSSLNSATVEQQNNSTSTTQRWRIPGRP